MSTKTSAPSVQNYAGQPTDSRPPQPDGTGWLAVAIITAGLVIRLAVAPWGAHAGDLSVLTRWAAALDEHGWTSIYTASDANYPPLALFLLAVSCKLDTLLMPGAPLTGPVWLTALKLPAMLADAGIAALAWRLADNRRIGVWITAALSLNPALIYLSAWWGQYESVYALLALAAVVAAGRGRPFWAGVGLGAGVMVKLQAAVAGPVVVLAAIAGIAPQAAGRLSSEARRTILALASGLALPIGLTMAPFAAVGQSELVWLRMIALTASPGWLTVNALNIWYLVTGGAGNWAYNAPLLWPDSTPLAAGLSARTVGLAMLAIWSAAVLILGWRARREGWQVWLLAGTLLYLGVFLWPTQAHERYALGAVVLLGGWLAHRRTEFGFPFLWHEAALYAMITVCHTLNLLWAAPFTLALEGWFAGARGIGLTIAVVTVLTAGWALSKEIVGARDSHPRH
jgi:Gpi18-like mannosyltransferase